MLLTLVLTITLNAHKESEHCSFERTRECSNDELFRMLDSQVWSSHPRGDGTAVRREIENRVPLEAVLEQIAVAKDAWSRDTLIDIAYHRDEPAVAKAFENMLDRGVEKGDCWMAQYLANRGHRRALEVLNEHYRDYAMSSYEWSFVIPVFGRQLFYPASENLIADINSASLNVVSEAIEALRRLYPGAPSRFERLEDAKAYFTARAKANDGAKQ